MTRFSLRTLHHVTTEIDAGGTAVLHFEPGRQLSFRAGQHGLLLVPGGGAKPLTLASAPEEALVAFATSLQSRSRFKRALAGMVDGSTVRLAGPLGGFTLDGTGASVVMLAQGMGITPFRAMLRHVVLSGAGPRTTLVHVGTRHPLRLDTEATAGSAHYPTSRQDFVVDVQRAFSEQPKATFMVSGSPAFVSATAALLVDDMGVDKSRIRRDAFYGYSPSAAEQPVSTG